MEYTNLGNTHLKVSRLCLGTMNFGVKTEEQEAFRIMDKALEAGINIFDTGNNYGKFIGKEGITEEIIGKWFAQGGNRREKVILTTKVYEDMGDVLDGANAEPGLSRFKIRRHLEDSLKRLQTDHLEIYFLHHIDRLMNWDEVIDTFSYLIMQGKIDYMATSNFPGWALADMAAFAKQKNIFGSICEEHRYNLLCRLPELEVIPSAKAHGMGVITYSPLAGGLLINCENEKNTDSQLGRYAALCHELGERPEIVALSWILHNPGITAPIIGPASVEELEKNLKVLECKLPKDFLEQLDLIFPGSGVAPESYAW